MAIPRPAPEQRKWWVIGIVGVLIGIGLATWWGISATRGGSWDNGPFTVNDSRSVKVTFYVTNQDGKPVRCTLEAQDITHNRVGVLTVNLPASHYTTTEYTQFVWPVIVATSFPVAASHTRTA